MQKQDTIRISHSIVINYNILLTTKYNETHARKCIE